MLLGIPPDLESPLHGAFTFYAPPFQAVTLAILIVTRSHDPGPIFMEPGLGSSDFDRLYFRNLG